MQSRTLSFNTAVFRRNIRSYWPVWGGYLFLMLWLLPAIVFMDAALSWNASAFDISYTILSDEVNIGSVMAAIFSAISALCIFSYMQKERSCSFFHALPETRLGLFFTNMISGLAFMWVPNIICAVLAGAILSARGISVWIPLLQWLLLISVEELFFYSFAVLCMMLTGILVFAPIMYTFYIFFTDFMLVPVNQLASELYFGIDYMAYEVPRSPVGIISPMLYSFRFNTDILTDEAGNSIRYVIEGYAGRTAVFALVGIALFVLAYLVYRNRASEAAGDFVAVKAARPVFRWGFAIGFSLWFTYLVELTLFSSFDHTRVLEIIIVILLAVLGMIGFIGAEMVLRKSFRVFKRIRFELPIFAVLMVLAGAVLVSDTFGLTQQIPDPSQVKEVTVRSNLLDCEISSEMGKEDVCRLHKYIIDSSDEILARRTDSILSDQREETRYFSLIYEMKDGSVIRRSYSIPEAMTGILDQMEEFSAENAVEIMFRDHSVSEVSYCEEYLGTETGYDYNGELLILHYDMVDAQTLYLAACEDLKAGNISAGRAQNNWNSHYYGGEEQTRYLTFCIDGRYFDNITFWYTDDCVNIMSAKETLNPIEIR